MGVPAFFRWLCRKYPSVVIECVENSQHDADGRIILEDASLPNPNGVEFDNLYLDMNGIIHPCTHPEDKPPPKNEDEMMVAIFECIDRIFSIVRPRKLLYMAIDGVAPRAKMNQQRARRFSSIKERVEKEEEIKKIRARLLEKGCILPPEKTSEEKFDSNCITPGTPFMENLSVCLQYYVHDRLNKDPGWKNIKVILSDANVPGEGEHKIMDYIRKQRAQPDHDPNTQHVLCGADADLIMLALATHEPNFTIIREEFTNMDTLPCAVCGRGGHDMNSCEGLDAPVNANENTISIGKEVKFIFARISVLREYLKAALRMPNLPFTYDFERVVDDWVFMCFFVGNDFLPHLPSLQIRENAIDRLVTLYKNCVYKTGGYLTDSGHVELSRVQKILTELGLVEDQIFGERQRREEQFKAREKAKRQRTDSRPPNMSHLHNSQFAATPLGRGVLPNAIENPRQEAARFRIMNMHTQAIPKNNAEARAGLEALIRPESGGKGVKRKTEEETVTEADEEEEDYQNNDEVKLWLPGFKERYYESKFDVPSTNSNFRYSVALQYVRGLCWVLKYYYQGCASWKWYFPYHYAPFASDFVNIEGLSTEFERGTKPFNPLEQLMSVFPAASGGHVPPCWSKLMDDPNSPIIDFYPEDFKVDLNGKKFSWQGVALLPFVDERRLFKALKPLYKDLSPAEVKRNQRGDSRLFVGPTNPGYKFLVTLYKNNVDKDQEIPVSIQGMRGVILICDDNVPAKGTLDSPIPGLPSINDNTVVTVKYRDPYYPEGYKFPAIRLKNAVDPPCILNTSNKVGNYKPRIGFDHNLPSASLDVAGHRMINHHTGNNSRNYQQQQDQGRSYGNVPPPDYNRINSQKVNVTALERLLAPLPNKPSCVDDRLFQLMKKFGALTCDLDRNRNDRNSRQYGDNRGFQQNNRDPRSQFQPFQQQGSSGPRQGNRQYNDNSMNQMSGRRPQNNQMGGGGNFQQQNRSMSGNNNFPGGYRQQNNNSGGGRWVSQAGYNFPNSQSNNNFNNNKNNNPANNNRFPNQPQQQQQQQGRYQPGNNRGLNNISTRFTQGGPNSNMGNRNRN